MTSRNAQIAKFIAAWTLGEEIVETHKNDISEWYRTYYGPLPYAKGKFTDESEQKMFIQGFLHKLENLRLEVLM
jgi:hypothetical protein